jgi:glycosyltransferase involved in cell wall biosynthesis/peptidoglycan/xylan/chitin deacetylase (PgdA/CDA1 family)
MHVPAERFVAVVRALRRVATLVPLRELVSLHLSGKRTRGLVSITFDDGYASVLSELGEMLRREAIPVTVFVVRDAAEHGTPFWWDRIDAVHAAAGVGRWREFEAACGMPEWFRDFHPADAGPLRPLRQWILAAHRGKWPQALEAPLAALEAETGAQPLQRPMTFTELDALVRCPGVEVAVHTASHAVLPLLGDDEVRQELRRGMTALRSRYDSTVPVLAAPFGLYDARTIRIAEEEGIEACLTLEAATLDDRAPSNLIPRFNLTAGHQPWKPVLYASGFYRGARRRPGDPLPYPELPSIPSRPSEKQGRPESAAGTPVPRRVLILADDLGGGTGNHLCKVMPFWDPARWQAVVVTQTAPLVHRLPPNTDVRVIHRRGWYDRFPIAQFLRFLEVARVARSVRPDLVHSYFFWSIMYGRVLKVMGAVAHLVENREDLGFSWGRGSYAALRALRQVPDRIICVADAVRHVVARREGVEDARLTVVRNGVDVGPPPATDREASRSAFGFQRGDVVIGMVANLPRAVKGGRRLLDAIGPIARAAPEARFLLVGVGADRKSLEPELEARGIEEWVVAAGYRTDVENCYAAMDISVLTSSSEGLSITILESMRHGLPTVVTRVGGNPEVVVDGETGFLVPLDDQAAFVDRVVALVRDGQLREQMGLAGRRRVVEHFATPDVAGHYLAAYEDVLRTHPRPAALSALVGSEITP